MDINTIVGVVVLIVVGGFAVALLSRFISLLQRFQPAPPPAPPAPPQPPAQPQPQAQPLNPYLRELEALQREADGLSGELMVANQDATNARLMMRAAQQRQLAEQQRAQAWAIYTKQPAQPGGSGQQPRGPQPGGPQAGAPKPGAPAPAGGPAPAPKPQPQTQRQTPPPAPAGPPPNP